MSLAPYSVTVDLGRANRMHPELVEFLLRKLTRKLARVVEGTRYEGFTNVVIITDQNWTTGNTLVTLYPVEPDIHGAP